MIITENSKLWKFVKVETVFYYFFNTVQMMKVP